MFSADLHIHSYFSPDSIIKPEILIKEAIKKKIDLICITDHNIFEESSELDYFINKYKKPLIVKGVELTTNVGDVLIYGLKNNFWKDLSDEVHPDINEVLKEVNNIGAVAVWAHPFREFSTYCYELDFSKYPEINIMETLNGRNSKTENKEAYNYAINNNYKTIGSSDSHRIEEFASCITLFKDKICSEDELIDVLKTGVYVPLTYNEYKTYDLKKVISVCA